MAEDAPAKAVDSEKVFSINKNEMLTKVLEKVSTKKNRAANQLEKQD